MYVEKEAYRYQWCKEIKVFAHFHFVYLLVEYIASRHNFHHLYWILARTLVVSLNKNFISGSFCLIPFSPTLKLPVYNKLGITHTVWFCLLKTTYRSDTWHSRILKYFGNIRMSYSVFALTLVIFSEKLHCTLSKATGESHRAFELKLCSSLIQRHQEIAMRLKRISQPNQQPVNITNRLNLHQRSKILINKPWS